MRVVRLLSMLLLAGMLLMPPPAPAQRRCAAAKVRAASKKASMKATCYRRAIARGLPAPDPTCLASAEDRFTRAFAMAEAVGDCLTTGDAADIEALVDQFLADLVTSLPVTTTSTTTSPTTTAPVCGTGGVCTGSCPGPGEFCQVAQQCFCGGQTYCVCSATTLTTCTVPTFCPTTTSLP